MVSEVRHHSVDTVLRVSGERLLGSICVCCDSLFVDQHYRVQCVHVMGRGQHVVWWQPVLTDLTDHDHALTCVYDMASTQFNCASGRHTFR